MPSPAFAKSNVRPPPQQNPATASLPFAEGSARTYAAAFFRSVITCSRGSFEIASRAASEVGKSDVRPPPGAVPERRSGAMAM